MSKKTPAFATMYETPDGKHTLDPYTYIEEEGVKFAKPNKVVLDANGKAAYAPLNRKARLMMKSNKFRNKANAKSG